MKKYPRLSDLNSRYQEEVPASRGLFPALFFMGLVFVLAWVLERSGLGVQALIFLKKRYFVFTQEPVLVWQIYIFLQTFVLKLGVVLLLLGYLRAVKTPLLAALGLDQPGKLSWRFYGFFFIFSVVIGVVSGLDPLAPAFPMHSFFGDALVWGNIAAVFSMVVVAPIAEEIFFRGFLYPALNRAFGFIGALVTVSLLFAAAHWRPDVEISTLAVIFAGSVWLTLARVLTRSTWVSIRLHALYNATILIVGVLRYVLLGY